MAQVKKWQKIILTLFLGLGLCFVSNTLGQAAPQTVTVKGTSGTGSLDEAREDARHDAVYKVLAHAISLADTRPEVVARVMDNYTAYVLQCKVLSRQQGGGHAQVVAEVLVDSDNLLAEVQRLVAAAQQDHRYLKACFLIRTVGTAQPLQANSIVNAACSSAYQRLGFETKTNDSYAVQRNGRYAALDGQSFEAFRSAMLDKLCNDWLEYQFALVGEVVVTTALEDALGVTKRAVVRVQAYDVLERKALAGLEEDYLLRGNTAAEAERLVLQKAAQAVAEDLGARTLTYWQEQEKVLQKTGEVMRQ